MSPEQSRDLRREKGMDAAPDATIKATPGQGERGRPRVRLEGTRLSVQFTRGLTLTPERPIRASEMPPTPTPRRVSTPIGHFPGANRTFTRPLTAAQSVARGERPAPRPLNTRILERNQDLLRSAGRFAFAGHRTPPTPASLVFGTHANQDAEARPVNHTPPRAPSEISDYEASPSPMQRAGRRNHRRMARRASSASGEHAPMAAGNPANWLAPAPGLPAITAQQLGSTGLQQPVGTNADFAGFDYENDITMGFSGNAELSHNHPAPARAGDDVIGTANNMRPIAPAPQPTTSTIQTPAVPANNGTNVFGNPNPGDLNANMSSPAGGAHAGGARQPSNNLQPHAAHYNVMNSNGAAAAQEFSNNGPSAAPYQFSGSDGGPLSANAGNANTGYANSGNDNAGYANFGNADAGNFNTGYANSGYANAGNANLNGFNSNGPNVDPAQHSSAVVLPDDINAAPRTAENPYYYNTSLAPAYQIPPVPNRLEGDHFHFNPYARPDTWSSMPDANAYRPPNVFESLNSHMWATGVCNEMDRIWIEGVQYGVGLGIESFKESLLDEIEIEGRVFGRTISRDNGNDSSLTMRNRIDNRCTAYFDCIQAAKAARKFISASNLLAETIVQKGFEGVIPAEGGVVAAEGMFPYNPEARAHTNALNAALAAEFHARSNGAAQEEHQAEARPLVGPRVIADRLPEYEGVSRDGPANRPLAAMIDNAIDATRIPEGMPNFSTPAEDLIFSEQEIFEMTGAAAAEVAARRERNENNRSSDVNAQPPHLSGDYDQPKSELIGEVSNRTMDGGARPRLSETDDGAAFVTFSGAKN